MEFPVSSAMDDVDGQVREDENSQVFVGAFHGVFVRSNSPDGNLDGTAALTTSPSRGNNTAKRWSSPTCSPSLARFARYSLKS